MRMRKIVLILLSGLYWALAIVVLALASVAPCGLAPGAWCELEGPTWLGAVLGALGPVGVLLLALVIYVSATWLVTRKWKLR
jgi:hypothetical protein